MSRKDKLLKKLFSRPKDFTYKELKSLLESIGYKELKTGKTSGSRVAYFNEKLKHIIRLHKPHPKTILKQYQIEYIVKEFNNQGILK